MSKQFRTQRVGRTVLQAGIPAKPVPHDPADARGMLLRGVVMATYVSDDPNHPFADDDFNAPCAVYCDVLCYSNRPGSTRYTPLKRVLVSQERSGLHSGHIWKPRATTLDITGQDLDPSRATNPGNMDGDHVLVGFMDQDFSTPVILRAVTHPGLDVGNEEKETGHRLCLTLEDGDPDFWKHNGSFFGVDVTGSHVIDTTHGNDGSLQDDGKEQDPPTAAGTGDQFSRLPQEGLSEISINDVSDPTTLTPVATRKFTKSLFEIAMDDAAAILDIKIEMGATLKVELKDADAKLTLGDGAVAVTIYENLETWWNTAVKVKYDAHIHPTGVGPSGPPAVAIDSMDTAAKSTHMLIPDA